MLFCYFKYFFLKFFLFFLIFLLFKQTNSLVCYSCLALNYRQHVLSRNDDLLPPQSRQNLSDLFESLKNNGFSSVEVSSSCADVALTTQPTFLNTPISICNKNDFCVKMDFYYFGEKVVVRNCLSMLMKLSSNVPLFCPVLPEEPSNLIIGNFQNVSICSCQTDLSFRTNSIYKCELGFSFILLILSFMEFLIHDSILLALTMILFSFLFFLLYFQLYFGCVYNCVALLKLHTLSSSILAFVCWISIIISLLFFDYLKFCTISNYRIICECYACLIICGSLLVTFAFTSFGKSLEIKSIELSAIDYLRKLLLKSFELFDEVQNEGKKHGLSPKNQNSLS